MKAGVLQSPGKVPSQVSIERAQVAATQCCLNILAALKEACNGDLDRVSACLRLEGFVASDSDFTNQPAIINAASDLIVEIFGESGKHSYRCKYFAAQRLRGDFRSIFHNVIMLDGKVLVIGYI
jgi:enamine deaminase RidA (YjgF/YER057c/UK114 family)